MENIDDLLAIDARVLRLLSHVRGNPRSATVGSFIDSERADELKRSRFYVDVGPLWEEGIVSAMDWAYQRDYFKIKKLRSIPTSYRGLCIYTSRRLEITRSGEVIADRFVRAENNCALRVEFVRQKLFDWLARDRHSRKGRGSRLVEFETNFFGHRVGCKNDLFGYRNDREEYKEVNDSALYLVDRGLIVGHYSESNYRRLHFDELTLTTEGLDCIKRDLRIIDYLNDRERRRNEQGDSSIVTNYHISDSQQFVAGSQKEVIQHNQFGLELQQIIELAQLVRQVAPTLNLDAQIEAKLVQVAGILEEEATDRPQERGRLRRAGEIMMKILRRAAPTAARDLLVATAEKALSTIIG